MITVVTPTIRGEKGLEWPRAGLENQNFRDFEWLVERHDPKDPPDFNQAMNRMLRKAKGELIVFLQDYIKPNPNGLQQFWDAYNKEPNVFWTAPIGKTDGESTSWDWRKHRGEDDCNFMEWEICWGAAPRDALKQIGGFDEELDKYWGFDNVNVGLRADMAGYKIKCLSNNVAKAQDHDSFMEHPYKELRNPDFHNMRLDLFRRGETINYL